MLFRSVSQSRYAGDSNQINQQLTHHLQQKHNLLIFPKNTTTDGLTLRTFHNRLLTNTIDNSITVQPIAIRYLRDDQPCPIAPFVNNDDILSHLLHLLSSSTYEMEIRLLEPIANESRSHNELTRHNQATITCTLQLNTPIILPTEAETNCQRITQPQRTNSAQPSHNHLHLTTTHR